MTAQNIQANFRVTFFVTVSVFKRSESNTLHLFSF